MSDLGSAALITAPSLPQSGAYNVVMWPALNFTSALVPAGEPPLPSTLLINGGVATTADRNVTLTIAAGEPGNRPAQMRISNEDGVGVWEAYDTVHEWTLSEQTEFPTQTKTVRVRFS